MTRILITLLIACFGCTPGLMAQNFNYPQNDSVKVCLEDYCNKTSLDAKKLLKHKSLELVTDNKEFKIVSFNLVVFKTPEDIIFNQTVKGNKLSNFHIGFFKGQVIGMTINSIVAANKQGKCFSLKEVHYDIIQ
jgi:hypothetical protein